MPGEDAPLKGVRRLLPRRVATYENRRLAITQYFELREALDGTLTDRGEAARLIGDLCKAAVVKRLQGAENIGLFLSGGLDSSSVALWLKEAGANVNAFTLDFGDNHIFTRDRRYFACQSHGAVYEPLTGLCVHGPCKGASLKPLAFTIENGELWIDVPEEIA